MSVLFTVNVDNSEYVKAQLKDQTALALDAVGQSAVSDVKLLVPVDTGRLRSSITYLVDDNQVAVGTNVEYGKYVEDDEDTLGQKHKTGQAHFLRDGITNNLGKYKEIIRRTLEG